MCVALCAGSEGHIPFRKYQNIASGMKYFYFHLVRDKYDFELNWFKNESASIKILL